MVSSNLLEVAWKRNIEKVVENIGELVLAGDCFYYDEFGVRQLIPEAAKAFEYAEQYKEQLRQQELQQQRNYRPNLLFSNLS